MRDHPIVEVFAWTGLVALLTAVLTVLIRAVGYGSFLGVGVPLTLLICAIRAANRNGGVAEHGFALGGILHTSNEDARPLWRVLWEGLPSALRECGVALLIAAVVFPPFALAFFFWNEPSHPFVWRWPGGSPLGLTEMLATHILVVGLTEEAFFRGYVQTRLQSAWPDAPRWLGVNARAWLLQSALFAVVHLIDRPHVASLAVFFPGLLFGWIRARRGGIGAAIVVHGLSNVYAELLYEGWLRAL